MLERWNDDKVDGLNAQMDERFYRHTVAPCAASTRSSQG